MKLYTILTLLFVNSIQLSSQTTISMEEAIQRIKTQHPQILQQDIYIQQQRILKDAGKNQPFLAIGYGAEELGAAGTGVHGIYLQQDFNLPAIAKQKTVLQEELAKAGEWQKLATQKQLERSISSLYQQLLFLKSQQKLNKELLLIYSKIEVMAQKRVAVGETGKLPLITTQSAKQQVLLQQMNMQQNYTEQFLRLQQFLLDSNLVGITDSILIPFKLPVQKNDLTQHPLIQQLNQTIRINTVQSKVIKSQLLPQLSTGLQLQVVGQTFPNVGLQIGVNVPLFQKGIKAQVQANALTTKILEQNKVWQLQQLNSQQTIALQNMVLLQKQMDYFERILLPTLEEQQELSQQAYRIGESGYLNVLQGLQQIIRAKRQYLQLIFQLNLAWIDYNFLAN